MRKAKETARLDEADARVRRFRQALSGRQSGQQVVDALRSGLAANDNLGFASAQVVALPAEATPGLHTGNIPAELLAHSGRILIVSSVAVLTPGLEAVEVSLVFGMLGPKAAPEEEPRAIYQNGIVVQSRLASGLDGSDQRVEPAELLDSLLAQQLAALRDSEVTSRDRKIARRKILRADKERRKNVGSCAPAAPACAQGKYVDYQQGSAARWLDDDAQALRTEFADVHAEAIRLLFAELTGQTSLRGSQMAFPPGSARQLPQLVQVNTEARHVYRMTRGQLLSLDKMSRLIPVNR